MKRRSFLQNKLWRDRTTELLEETGSIIHWRRLEDADYDEQLRSKLLEEANEVGQANSQADLCDELADVLEVIECLSLLNGLSMEDLLLAKKRKQVQRGSFVNRQYVTAAEHLEGSFGESYCLADPIKYPEIFS